MATLPGSVLWLFLLVYLVHGHNVDNFSSDKSSLALDDAEKSVNRTETRHNEEEKTNENTELETKKEEAKNKQTNSLINKTETRPRSTIVKPQDSNGIHLSESFNNRNKRRRVVYKSKNVTNVTDVPLMSVDRRNSYKSIADRRRFYNRTRLANKKSDNVVEKDVLELQETTNRPYLPQEKVIQMNEIRDKQGAFKDSSKIVTDKKNGTTNQRINVGMLNNETLPKTVNVKQTVIQPRLEFGQKLSWTDNNNNNNKPNIRNPSIRYDKPKRRKEKTKDELVIENSTNKFNKNFQTQSTKLLRVDKNHWSTTRIPKAETDMDNLIMPLFRNQSNLEKMSKYTKINNTKPLVDEAKVFSNVVTSISVKNSEVTKLANQTESPILQNDTIVPLPLSLESMRPTSANATEITDLNIIVPNITTERTTPTTLSYEEELIRRHVYGQEIYKLSNATRRPLWNRTRVEETSEKSISFTVNNTDGEKSHKRIYVDSRLAKSLENSTSVVNTTILSTTEPVRWTIKPLNESVPRRPILEVKDDNIGGRRSSPIVLNSRNHGRSSNISSQIVGNADKTNITKRPIIVNDNVPYESKATTASSAVTEKDKSTTPESQVVKSTLRNYGRTYSAKISSGNELRYQTPRIDPSKVQLASTTSTTSTTTTTTSTTTTTTTTTTPKTTTTSEAWNSTEEYPLTIEINENNKRVLSEMFQTTTMTDSTKNDVPVVPSTSRPKDVQTSTTTSTTTRAPSTTSSTTTTTTESSVLNIADESEHDHKSVGTSFNTKFYIVPNVTRTEVIKIVESDDDGDEEVLVTAQTVGIAIYVLAAFGLIPLLLALVFATKFLVQRHRRKDDCDSDMRSDISTNDTRRHKLKGSTELKKSPSNVTTTTLVATTRLPRVQHWETHEKHNTKNWEFPRSKLTLQTILGQGNFGQVWKAEAEDMTGHEGLTRLVAVKTVKEGATEKEHAELIKELEIMQQIGSHPNIVTLLGCCTEQEPYYLIMEYVMYGKLLTFLREHRTNENYYNFSNNSDALTSRDLTVFAYCVARGMEYLASKGIIHRDLAARNVLVDHNKLCKIADFGMSRSVRDSEDGQVYEERQHKGALPIRWMAPESLLYSVFTHKSDVWSFGIVMWEIVTLGSTPYPNMGAREVMRRVRDGYRLERPNHCKPELYRLISHCWSHDPNKRPDFTELRHELSSLLDDPTKDGSYVDLERFAVDNRFHVSNKTNDLRLLERNEFKTLKRLGEWETQDWVEETKKSRSKRSRNNGKGTVTLTGHGSFTVNSRILEKEFKMV